MLTSTDRQRLRTLAESRAQTGKKPTNTDCNGSTVLLPVEPSETRYPGGHHACWFATINDSNLDPMRDIETCALCGRLRVAYSDATLECVRLNNELRHAERLGDSSRVADLAPKCEAAKRHRSNVLEVTRAHVAEVHPAR